MFPSRLPILTALWPYRHNTEVARYNLKSPGGQGKKTLLWPLLQNSPETTEWDVVDNLQKCLELIFMSLLTNFFLYALAL